MADLTISCCSSTRGRVSELKFDCETDGQLLDQTTDQYDPGADDDG